MVPPGLEPYVYILVNQLVIKITGAFWVPTESLTAFTLSHPPLVYSPVWTLTNVRSNFLVLILSYIVTHNQTNKLYGFL